MVFFFGGSKTCNQRCWPGYASKGYRVLVVDAGEFNLGRCILMNLKPIGIIHSPFHRSEDAPFQGRLANAIAVLEIYPEFAAGLKDVTDASHLIVLYWCHNADRERLLAKPPHDNQVHGVFACRSPHRPNPIAFCVVELLAREGNRLTVRGLDALDGSPLLDIKPYSSEIDAVEGAKIGWWERAKEKNKDT